MVGAIFSLLVNAFVSGLAVIGGCTVINKLGKFFIVIENEKKDGYKKGFDNVMAESIDEINKCVESVGIISNNFSKIIFTIYDITTGNKVIRKNKDGKIIIAEKGAIEITYKNKLDILNDKVKKYEEELKKVRENNLKTNKNEENTKQENEKDNTATKDNIENDTEDDVEDDAEDYADDDAEDDADDDAEDDTEDEFYLEKDSSE